MSTLANYVAITRICMCVDTRKYIWYVLDEHASRYIDPCPIVRTYLELCSIQTYVAFTNDQSYSVSKWPWPDLLSMINDVANRSGRVYTIY